MRLKNTIQHFIKLETLSGVLLLISVLLALITSNSSLADGYQALVELPISITVGKFLLQKPLIKWVNDGLMALFFLLITLEVKVHLNEGELNSRKTLLLPCLAAVGGAIVPIILYCMFTIHDPIYLKGWAIPLCTDTPFVLAILSFFPRSVPLSTKIFVTALSIVDDIFAVLVIALFYTTSLHFMPMLIAFICLLILVAVNFLRIRSLVLYLIIGAILWFCLVEAGIHGTLAGVLLGVFIPMRDKRDEKSINSPLNRLEKYLHPLVAFVILPIFAFLNSGISFKTLTLPYDLFAPITLGIIIGLFIGKQLGIIGVTYLSVRLKLCKLPENISWLTYYGISILCGIGFTFSLFIGGLSFDEIKHLNQMRLGVLLGSILSGIGGIIILQRALKKF